MWINVAFLDFPERRDKHIQEYVTTSRLLIEMHTEQFSHNDLLTLTRPLTHNKLTSAYNGRTVVLVRKLDVP